MTTEKMPDVIWAYNDGCTVEITCPPTEHDIFPHAEYIRAEPVKELLKQARDIVDCYNAEYNTCDDLLTAIDKFLGEK